MKKSIFWLIVALIAILFTTHAACTYQFVSAMTGITICCISLVISAWYEREEREQKENHQS